MMFSPPGPTVLRRAGSSRRSLGIARHAWAAPPARRSAPAPPRSIPIPFRPAGGCSADRVPPRRRPCAALPPWLPTTARRSRPS
eukprot:scaffold23233_cov30-Tisochrysis_lutea.AAC.2